jgi:hypothetical protein
MARKRDRVHRYSVKRTTTVHEEVPVRVPRAQRAQEGKLLIEMPLRVTLPGGEAITCKMEYDPFELLCPKEANCESCKLAAEIFERFGTDLTEERMIPRGCQIFSEKQENMVKEAEAKMLKMVPI